jgi:hypothetical protein
MSQKIMKIKRWIGCIGAVGWAIAIASPSFAKPLPLGAQVKQPDLSRRVYQGYDDDPDYCDTKPISGWFVWYYDISGQCTITIVANEQEALRRSAELFNHSFSVMVAGFGFK